MLEGLRHRGQDLESEYLPQMHGRGVGLDNGVELDPVVALTPGPIHHVVPECPADALAGRRRVDHEAGGRDVRATPGPVRTHLRGTQHLAAVLVTGADG